MAAPVLITLTRGTLPFGLARRAVIAGHAHGTQTASRFMNQAAIRAEETPAKDGTSWLPVVLWGIVIFLLSTSTFSSLNTSRIIDPILRWLIPSLSGVG